ncbi:hypothetical protein MKA38_08925 [[Clostridium] innocuum]|nr:hypothetical protein [[Clostridium] innocuum]
MEADIILKEDEIEEAFESARSDFLSYLDKSIERLKDEQDLTGQYKEDMITGREGMVILLPIFLDMFRAALHEHVRTRTPLLAVELIEETNDLDTTWGIGVMIAEELCRRAGVDHKKVSEDMEATLLEFEKVLTEYYCKMGNDAQADAVASDIPDGGYQA